MIRVVHNKISLALHQLSEGPGRPLLLLHGLGERTPEARPPELESWPGPVYGLDFTGHGDSTVPKGGGYSAEILMGDADAAVEHLGAVTVVGRGVGAYVGLLLAGARPTRVRGMVLRDGPGMWGGGARPGGPLLAMVDPAFEAPPDPFALVELSKDVRPPDYATAFVRQATHLSGLIRPVTVCAIERPEWLAAVVEEPGVEVSTLDEALDHYRSVE